MHNGAENSPRQANYDLLRAISCVTVVLLHVSAMYVGNNFRDIVGRNEFLTASCFRVMTQMSVPCFVMLSGAFLLKQEKNADLKSFYIKSAKKLGIPILVFSILYVLFHYVENIIGRGYKGDYQFNVYEPLIDWLNGEPHTTMWYMYMIIPLYLITPFLVIIKKNVSKRVWHISAVVMMVYSILVSYTCSLSWILQFAEWIGFFMMGDFISELGNDRFDIKISRHPSMCVGLSYLVLLLYWYTHTNKTMTISGPAFLAPVNVTASLLLFVGFAYIQVNDHMLIRTISGYSFYVYLIHPFICEVLMQLFGRVLQWFPPAWLIPLYALCITAVCILIKWSFDHIIKRICALRERRGNMVDR